MGDLAGPEQLLSLGPVSSGLTVSAARADKGATLLELHSGASPLRLWIAADDPRASLQTEHSAGAVALEGAQGVLAFDLAPKTLLRVRCTPATASQTLRITAKLADGTVSEGALRLDWLPWARRTKK